MTLSDLAHADLVIEHHGSVTLLRPMTRAAALWLNDNVSSEPWQWLGEALSCEPRMVPDIMAGAAEAGLVVAA